jgi:myo-inositol 2-dehydrogenase/D-chiro-inositol 1-dehydrogenase
LIKVGFIGLGQMGKQHLADCLHMTEVKVVAAADTSKKALNKAKAQGVANIYTDYAELLKKEKNNVDAIIISVPNFLHFDAIRLALENSFNVFTEKPLAVNVQQCKDIVKLAQDSGRKFMIGHNSRFHPAVEQIKANLEKGTIGNLEVATIEDISNGPFSHPRVPAPVANWWFDPQKSGGGALLDLGYHMIDLFNFFTGEDADVIFSDLSFKYNLPIEEGATIVLSTTKSQIRGIINVGWYQKSVFPKLNFRAILHGDAGFLSTDDLVPKKMYYYAVKEGAKNVLKRIVGKKVRRLSYTYYWESYYKELTSFFECIEKDTVPPTSAVDGLKTMQVIENAYKIYGDTEGRKNVDFC